MVNSIWWSLRINLITVINVIFICIITSCIINICIIIITITKILLLFLTNNNNNNNNILVIMILTSLVTVVTYLSTELGHRPWRLSGVLLWWRVYVSVERTHECDQPRHSTGSGTLGEALPGAEPVLCSDNAGRLVLLVFGQQLQRCAEELQEHGSTSLRVSLIQRWLDQNIQYGLSAELNWVGGVCVGSLVYMSLWSERGAVSPKLNGLRCKEFSSDVLRKVITGYCLRSYSTFEMLRRARSLFSGCWRSSMKSIFLFINVLFVSWLKQVMVQNYYLLDAMYDGCVI